ncbi:MAG: SHOCT domain-containing protein [Alphaproteobacteria bacterium]|uniref:SHOCT domain-containing protein n=1 Tax=Candidatus Nitrobium versatile TaxID=2884831 RepID=A0A953SI43_9BACT|nr:SHOCT domain-containing protein [Candidatus Nitrobium versatile]
MYGGMGIWMVINLLFLVLLIAGIVLLVVWLVRRPEKNTSGRIEESAMEILKRRYARGEISKEEYERMRKDLS